MPVRVNQNRTDAEPENGKKQKKLAETHYEIIMSYENLQGQVIILCYFFGGATPFTRKE